MPIPFSIIIPTRRRPQALVQTLSQLNKLSYPRNAFEVIVVENDPKDTLTKDALLKYRQTDKQTNKASCRYFSTIQRGASHGRNKGVAEAKYDHLIFIDDDILVKPEFLQGYADAWKAYPHARILGGRVIAELDNGREFTITQKKLLQKYPWCFAHQDWMVRDTPMTFNFTVYSANLSYRRNKNERSIFSRQLGVQMYDDIHLGAEDFELCVRTILKKEQVFHLASKAVEVRHRISPNRFDPHYISKRFFFAGIEMYILEVITHQNFPHFKSFYRQFMTTPFGLKLLLLDKHERTMLASYLFNGKMFG